MYFRLLYSGPLKAGGKDKRHIQSIRQYLRPQLEALWQHPPLSMPSPEKVTSAIIGHQDLLPVVTMAGKTFQPIVHSNLSLLAELDVLFLRPRAPGEVITAGGDLPSPDNRIKTFQPIVHSNLSLLAELDVLFLRPRAPGEVITAGGDLDNRIKTLFDALKPPDQNQAVGVLGASDPDPFCVLLEDDRLVSRFSVTTDRLLAPQGESGLSDDVHLVISVRVTATHAHLDNLHLIGP